ncbi:MAG: hypothetical protein AAB945_00545 [Patescibacteria group bacterium]
MNTLIVSQIIFYFTTSIAIIALGILLSYAIYQLIRILKNTRDVSEDISNTYAKTKKKIKKVISSIKG